ncbi:MAG TPA: outer membrane beta-barrel protein [Gemmatimonadales bacterium]|nr:outer membrane beta-barrel protein [Gemmatimonadales bacterium]
MPRCSLLLCFVAAAQPAAAQLEFTPYVGVYIPTAHLIDEPNNSQYSYVKHDAERAGGIKLTAWIRPRIALEGDALYSPSGTTGPTFGDQSGKVGIASFRLLYAASSWEHSSLYAFAGPAAAFHRGAAWDSVTTIRAANGMSTSSSSWGGVFGIGVRGNRKGPVTWHVEVLDNYYEFPGIFTPQKQNDVVISAGLRLVFSGPSH